MKTIIIMIASGLLSVGAFAQRKGFHRMPHPVTRVVVTPAIGLGFGFGYPYYGYPYYPFGYPYYGHTPYRLSSQIQAVKVDYRSRIRVVRHDKSISHAQRRQQIRELKADRAHAIADTERNFYDRQASRNYRNGYNGDQ